MKISTYQTERLFFRPTLIEDAKFILELLNTPQWIQNIGNRNLHSIKDAENYILKKMVPQYKKLGFSNNTVIRKSDHKKIGTCGLYKRDGLQSIDIGFAFLPKFQKQGYAYEASKELINIAFEDFNIDSLNAITTKENIASQKLIKKLGFTYLKIVTIAKEDFMLYALRYDNFNKS